ncbi:hypothetical protein BC939DRAFT_508834 [Gamsiella multidivaricata]|uniref:uncharacterized protein n=1 Tax=Gamsiella multidivaricata TaxID=101098 RepID=UPI0022203B9F|nr:uncharacterized protein BC939DRAFT_508834 [Gamsiella multidivaricata]KAI7815901.1 hypothetical protein BC939DRAFT_508834 [Gamsiella multidivaricata]
MSDSGASSSENTQGTGTRAPLVEGAMQNLNLNGSASNGEDNTMEVDDDASTMTFEGMTEICRTTSESLKTLTQTMGQQYLIQSKPNATPESVALFKKTAAEVEKAKTELKMWSSMLENMQLSGRIEYECERRVESQSSLSREVKRSGDDDSVSLAPECPRFHRPVELPHTLPKLGAKVTGPLITNVREFLFKFKSHGETSKGLKKFNLLCMRMLKLANMDEKVDTAFEAAIRAKPDASWDWTLCEETFVNCALTPMEKSIEVENFAREGKEKGEAYDEYSLRLRRTADVYKIHELPKCADVTQTLRMSVPSMALTMMTVAYKLDLVMDRIGMEKPDDTTLDFFIKSMSFMHGPDDSAQWKAMIEAGKKARLLKETRQQDARDAASKIGQKKGTSNGNGTAVKQEHAAVEGAPSQVSHRGGFRGGHYGGAFGGRGGAFGGRGGFRFRGRGNHGKSPYPSPATQSGAQQQGR